MHSSDHGTDLLDCIALPCTDEPASRDDWAAAGSSHERSEQPAVSDSKRLKSDDPIFHSLVVSGDALQPQNRWAFFGSLVLQSLLVVAIAACSVSRLEPAPKRRILQTLYLQPMPAVQPPPQPPKVKVPKRAVTHTPATRMPAAGVVRTPQQVSSNSVSTPLQLSVGTIGGVAGGEIGDVAPAPHTVPLPEKTPEPAPAKRIRVAARVAEANLIHDVQPQYPPEAGRERIEGSVVLLAVIGTDGTVKDIQVESGPPVLAQAAIQAVKQWRYRPYLLNGVPVEIDSRITINFAISRG